MTPSQAAMDKAREIARRYYPGSDTAEAYLANAIASALIEAREMERQRCAEIAEAEAKSERAWAKKYFADGMQKEMDNAVGGACSAEDIAAAIRGSGK